MSRPPKFQLVDLKLDEDLASYLERRRTDGDDKLSFDEIAFEIRERTGVKVTGVTVSNWCSLIATPAEAAS